jgi:hypothetical protein
LRELFTLPPSLSRFVPKILFMIVHNLIGNFILYDCIIANFNVKCM